MRYINGDIQLPTTIIEAKLKVCAVAYLIKYRHCKKMTTNHYHKL